MSTFDNREKNFENKYALDEELKFKITNRRNKLLGLWAAEQLGKAGDAAEAYAKEVVMSDFELPGDADVIHKVLSDLSAAGIGLKESDIVNEIAKLEPVARQQVMEGK
ncbi:MAG: DUF1476 domain-containing protein [Alphaproteobacteria bacterium]|nr:DUF1476 domain-containing protein [Alphaproteobacteria bacterium]